MTSLRQNTICPSPGNDIKSGAHLECHQGYILLEEYLVFRSHRKSMIPPTSADCINNSGALESPRCLLDFLSTRSCTNVCAGRWRAVGDASLRTGQNGGHDEQSITVRS